MATRSTPIVGFGTLVVTLTVVAALFALGGNGVPDTAFANVTVTPTNTVAKPDDDGSLSGVTDIWVGTADASTTLFDCIALTDHDTTGGATDPVKSALVCNSELDLGDPQAGNLVDNIPGEGSNETPNTGPPPPPPYTPDDPQKGSGTYNPGTDTLTVTACFSNLGGSLGPNVIWVMTIASAKASASGLGTGTVDIYGGQTNAACTALTPAGGPTFAALPLFTCYRVASCTPPWATAGDTDHDDDGCTDADELDKDARPKGCGDDPWNPGDSGTAMDDISGDYDILITVVRGDVGTPGFYYSCLGDIQHNTGTNDVTARVSCYIDASTLTVNPEVAGTGTCTAGVNNQQCGDGYPGGSPPRQPPPPEGGAAEAAGNCTGANTGVDNDSDTVPDDGCPGIYGDVNTKHTEWTGNLDKVNNTLNLEGCFEDVDGAFQLSHVFVRAKIDQYTGHGVVHIFSVQTLANCTGGTPTGAGGIAPLDLVRQNDATGDQLKSGGTCDKTNPSNCGRDSDGDGCPNKQELSDTPKSGGLRDPFNPWDYFEATNGVGTQNLNGQIRITDILETVTQFFVDWPSAGYRPGTDRTGLANANAHNLSGPNYQQRLDDILAAVKQFFHDCGSGASRIIGAGGGSSPPPTPSNSLEFSIGIDTNGDEDDCNTGGGGTGCTVRQDGTFNVMVRLDALPAESTGAYLGWDAVLNYTGVSAKGLPTFAWPDCDLPASHSAIAGVAAASCAIDPFGNPSSYTGLLVSLPFNCTASGTIALVHGQGATVLHDSGNATFVEDAPGETLSIHCGPETTPTPKPTPTPNPSADGSMEIDSDCDDPFTPLQFASVQTQRYAVVGETFPVCVYTHFPTGSASGYQVRVHWAEDLLDFVPRTAAENEIWHQQPVSAGGPPNGADYSQDPGPADDGSGSEAFVRIQATDALDQNASPAYEGALTQLLFTCQAHGSGNIELRGPGISDGSVFYSGGTVKPSLRAAVIICLEPNRDSDTDGCPNEEELGDVATFGGQRNPLNEYDYFNPTHDGLNRVDDILKVVSQYFKDDTDGNPGQPPYTIGYNPDTDRTDDPAFGPEQPWRLLGPNGLQRVDDVLFSVKQFFHDCP